MAIKRSTHGFGSCRIDAITPARSRLSSLTAKVNVFVTFEEALKLNVSIDEAVRKLSSRDRRTKASGEWQLRLVVDLKNNRLDVFEG